MTDSKDKQSAKDLPPEQRLAGLFRLVADDVQAQGDKPDLKEIQDWQLGKLDEPRASEVKSHIARDPECYQLWSELVATEKPVQTDAESTRVKKVNTWIKFKQWWTKPTQAWAGTGLVTTMLLIIIVFLPQAGPWSPLDEPVTAELGYDWPYESMSSTRGGELEYRQKLALQSGLRKSIKATTQAKQHWQAATNNLPASPLPCHDQRDVNLCEKETGLYTRVGVHAGVLYLACLDFQHHQQRSFDDVYWQNLTSSWQRLEKEGRDELNPVLQEKISQISTSTTKGQQCETVRDVIFMSY